MTYRHIHIGCIAALAASLAGCTDMLQPAEAPHAEPSGVPIELTVSIDGRQGLMASPSGSYQPQYNPSPRRIVDFTGEQAVNDLRIYVFSSATADGRFIYAGGGDCPDGAYSVPAFANTRPYQSPDGRMEQYNFTFSPLLEAGRYYKLLAVGRDDRDGTPVPSRTVEFIPWGTRTLSDVNVTVGVTEFCEASISSKLLYTHYPAQCTELFTGKLTWTDTDGTVHDDILYVSPDSPGFTKHIELTRAVAGLYVYVTDIPTETADNSGRDGFDGLTFHPNEMTIYLTYISDYIGLADQNDLDPNHKHVIQVGYIDFTNRYGQRDDTNWYAEGDYWRRDEIPNYKGVTIEKDCALMSNFMFPVDFTRTPSGANESTLMFQLREHESDFTFTKQLKFRITSEEDPATGQQHPSTDATSYFPITPNCIYALGRPNQPYSLKKLSSRSADDVLEGELISF